MFLCRVCNLEFFKNWMLFIDVVHVKVKISWLCCCIDCRFEINLNLHISVPCLVFAISIYIHQSVKKKKKNIDRRHWLSCRQALPSSKTWKLIMTRNIACHKAKVSSLPPNSSESNEWASMTRMIFSHRGLTLKPTGLEGFVVRPHRTLPKVQNFCNPDCFFCLDRRKAPSVLMKNYVHKKRLIWYSVSYIFLIVFDCCCKERTELKETLNFSS